MCRQCHEESVIGVPCKRKVEQQRKLEEKKKERKRGRERNDGQHLKMSVSKKKKSKFFWQCKFFFFFLEFRKIKEVLKKDVGLYCCLFVEGMSGKKKKY